MINVYFESDKHAECVLTVRNEEIYMAILPSLMKMAKKHRCIVTETVVSTDSKTYDKVVMDALFVKWMDKAEELLMSGDGEDIAQGKGIAESVTEIFKELEKSCD